MMSPITRTHQLRHVGPKKNRIITLFDQGTPSRPKQNVIITFGERGEYKGKPVWERQIGIVLPPEDFSLLCYKLIEIQSHRGPLLVEPKMMILENILEGVSCPSPT